MFCSRACEGLRLSRSITAIGVLVDLEGAGPSAPPNPIRTMFCSRGCKGLQLSKSITAIGVLNDLEMRPVSRCRRTRSGQCSAPAAGLQPGLQPSKSITAIEVLIGTWRPPAPSALSRRSVTEQCRRMRGSASAPCNSVYVDSRASFANDFRCILVFAKT